MNRDDTTGTNSFFFHNMQNSKVYRVENESIIGREENVDICLDDPNISSKHLKIIVKNNRIFLIDLGSSNGTKINSISIPPYQEIRLRVGDNITIGKLNLQLSKKSKPILKESSFNIVFGASDIFNSNNFDNKFEKMISSDSKPLSEISLNSEEQNIQNRIEELLDKKVELKDYLQILEKKRKQEDYLFNQVDLIDSNNKDLFEKGQELKTYYESNKHKLAELIDEIPRLEAKLKLMKLTKTQIEAVFKEFDEFKLLERKRSKYSLELKSISREKVLQKISETKNELREVRLALRNLQAEIEDKKQKEKEKAQAEKDKIRDQINKLQKKLGNAS